MASIDKLPSGKWRSRIYIGNGKCKTITGKSEREVKQKAKQFEAEKTLGLADEPTEVDRITVAEAIDRYISTKTNILSPATIRGYRVVQRNCLKSLDKICLYELTQELVQTAVNKDAETMSPKYLRNAHGLLSAALRLYKPELTLHTTLPQKEKHEIAVPTEEEMAKLFEAVKGTEIELPIYLAACCGLRQSEVCGLKWSDIDFEHDTISINEARVLNEKNEFVSKGTKTIAGTRTLKLYPFVRGKLAEYEKVAKADARYVVSMKSIQIYHAFERALEIAGLKHYRFHDLRHYTVSVMLALNVPKKYIADYMGHETENMIDRVYGHIMASKKTEVQDMMQDYFERLVTKLVTK